jgi:receptor protein-tyrosine kinase/non-specific protein-tyrosine kinase
MHAMETEERDLRDYLGLLRRRGWILLVCVIVLPILVYKYTETFPKKFEASTTLQIQSAADNALIGGTDSGSANVQAVASFVGTTAVADEAARQLKRPRGSLYGAAHATADPDTGFVTITATGPTAQAAKATANAFASALNATRGKRGIQAITKAIQQVQQTLANTPKTDIATRNQLQTQLNQLTTLRQAQSQNLTVLQPALGATQIAPHPKRNATIAIILAILIGSGLIALSERFDRKLRKPEDLEQLTGLPFLATIPHDAFPGTDTTPDVPEAFQTLRNSLTYFNADGNFNSLAVTSGLQGEGKTTVAANLALAYASFGKRVIVVDTDLRKPDLAARLGFDDSTGLTEVLAGNSTLEAALREVQPFGAAFRLLPAGPVPPNPSALLGSQKMLAVLDELTADADLVILDTTPVLMVSDAFPLLEKVSGVVALARLDGTPRAALRRLVHIVSSVGGQILGLVATDGKRLIKTSYGYGYGYGYGEKQKPKRRAKQAEGEAEAPAEPAVDPASALLPPPAAASNGTADAAESASSGVHGADPQ